MLTTEQVKQTINYMGWEVMLKNGEFYINISPLYDMANEKWEDFNPCAHEWNSRIFEKLVDECRKKEYGLSFSFQSCHSNCIAVDTGPEELYFWADELNESICLALIAVMDSKK